MSDWISKLGKVKEQLSEYERKKYTLNEEKLEENMPKCVAFYNNHPDDKDVYRVSGGCIFLIQTPEKETDEDGNITNLPSGPYEAEWKEEPDYLLMCTFRIYNRTELLSIFAPKSVWNKIKIFSKKAFIYGFLTVKYSKIGVKGKPMLEEEFIKKHGFDNLEDMDVDEYRTLYSTNLLQIISVGDI